MGAVVRKSLPDGSTVAGNPAQLTSELKRQSQLLKKLESTLELQQEQ
jgi:acetyltransferase-like isoleucine patch superfamily enzyme